MKYLSLSLILLSLSALASVEEGVDVVGVVKKFNKEMVEVKDKNEQRICIPRLLVDERSEALKVGNLVRLNVLADDVTYGQNCSDVKP